MNISKDKIYFQIKNRYPELNHSDILNIQNQVLIKIRNRNQHYDNSINQNLKNENLNSRYQSQTNLRNNENIIKNSEYIPRVKVAEFQDKIQRNELEDNYQVFYKQREDYTQQEYYNAMVKNGKNFNENNDLKRSNFLKEELNRRSKFDEEQKFREQKYAEEEKKRFEQFKVELDDINNLNIDPLNLFNLSKDFSLDELKSSYRKLALKHHPDRKGDPKIFKIISKAFIILQEKYKNNKEQKEYVDLKNNFNNFKEEQKNYQSTFKLDPEKFNIDRFNQLYEQNRQDTSNDSGYGEWTTDDTSESPTQIFSDKFNLNMFNSVFNEQKKTDKNCNSLTEFLDPLPSDKGTAMNYTDISDSAISNFSSDINSNLQFTDYKEAHTFTKLINTDSVKRKEYSSIDDLEKDRSNISYQMSESDLMRYNFQKAKEQEEEQNRIHRIKNQGEFNEQQFNKLNKLMISNFS